MNELKQIIEILNNIEYLSSNNQGNDKDRISERLQINVLSIRALQYCDILNRKIRRLKQR